MAQVTHGKRLADDEEPEKHVAAEGKRILKDLVAQQLNTKLTLDNQQKRERTFVPGVPLDDSGAPSGTVSVAAYSALREQDEIRSILLGAGVSAEDVDKLFSSERGNLSGPENLAWRQLWEEAAEKLLQANSCLDAQPVSQLSRHDKELGECVPATGIYSQILQAGRKPLPSTSTAACEGLPAVELQKAEKELFGHLHSAPVPPATSRKRRRTRRIIDSLSSHKDSVLGDDAQTPSRRGFTLWDVKEVPNEPEPPPPPPPPPLPTIKSQSTSSKKQSKTVGCSQQRLFTIQDGAIVEIKGKQISDSIKYDVSSSSNIDENNSRMTVDEIKRIPKFSNYDAGTPSKVLFVKNFPTRLSESELLAVFSSFSPLEWRVMEGKMKGQAFVTFADEEAAQRALDGVIGTIVENKPLIVQFGRSQTSNKTGT